ncbi:MAG TPA: insulinase family protein, partial [Kofleriaceae bacterium]|nr:insulinase family protein [Kofleriaceae bacterium]
MFVARAPLVVAGVALAVLPACTHFASPPRFGSLKTERRRFEFAHNIELFEVANGMKVALIPDDRTNLVTVDVRYQVGAAEDPPGRAGMAHLVEHLVFEGRTTPGGPTLASWLSDLSLSFNAWTRPDETHYTTTAPAGNLEELLALEARRMRFTCAQLDQATFARERDVVLSEEAEHAGPADVVGRTLYEAVYGADHPYARAMIRGEVAAATREEVCAFVAEHYTPERAILVVTGPIDPARTSAAIGATFGPIPRGYGARTPLPAPKPTAGSILRDGPVDHPTVVVVFPQPPWGAEGHRAAELVEHQLDDAIRRAAKDQPWILGTGVGRLGDRRALMTEVVVELQDGARADDAARLVRAAAAKLGEEGELWSKVHRSLGALELAVVDAWDRLGARGAWVADYLQYVDHRWFMLSDLAEIERLRLPRVRWRGEAVAAQSHVVVIRPDSRALRSSLLALPSLQSHDLQPWRTPVDPAEARRPLAARPAHLSDRAVAFELGNGLRVVLAPDRRSPIVDARLVFPGGTAHEPRDRPGLAKAAAYLLDHDREGYYPRADVDRIDWAARRGTQTAIGVDETTTTFSARGLAHYADWHVWQLSWWLDKGIYDDASIAALRAVARNATERDRPPEPDETSLRFQQRLFGDGHPYATPPYRVEALLRIGASDLRRWQRDHYRARGATLIVSGGFELAKMRALVTEL